MGGRAGGAWIKEPGAPNVNLGARLGALCSGFMDRCGQCAKDDTANLLCSQAPFFKQSDVQ